MIDSASSDPSEREGFRAKDLLRKVFLSGVGALFMTEEGVRSLVKELKLPKEALAGALAQADRTKSELVRMVGAEVRTFLEGSKVREDLLDLLTQVTFEVKAEVAIKPRGEVGSALEPEVKSKVTVKRKTAARRATKKAPAKPRSRS